MTELITIGFLLVGIGVTCIVLADKILIDIYEVIEYSIDEPMLISHFVITRSEKKAKKIKQEWQENSFYPVEIEIVKTRIE